MAALKAIYDRATGRNPVLIRVQDDLDALVDRVRDLAVAQGCPVVAEFSDADDPWGHAVLEVGIGEERGFVRENWTPARATRGGAAAPAPVRYDDQGTGVDIPADQEVPLALVREVLAAYLAHDGRIPPDHPHLNIVS